MPTKKQKLTHQSSTKNHKVRENPHIQASIPPPTEWATSLLEALGSTWKHLEANNRTVLQTNFMISFRLTKEKTFLWKTWPNWVHSCMKQNRMLWLANCRFDHYECGFWSNNWVPEAVSYFACWKKNDCLKKQFALIVRPSEHPY